MFLNGSRKGMKQNENENKEDEKVWKREENVYRKRSYRKKKVNKVDQNRKAEKR